MAKTTERKLVLRVPEGGKITQVNIGDDGKSVEVVITTEEIQEQKTAVENIDTFNNPNFPNNKAVGWFVLDV